MTNEESQGAISEIVGARVRHERDKLHWSVEELAEACAKVGATHLTVNALYALESGRKERITGRRRRHVTVDELLALAAALKVHPVDLLVPPDLPDAAVYAVAPAVDTPAATARRWIAGDGFLTRLTSSTDLFHAVRAMPKDRADHLIDQWMRNPGPETIAREAGRLRRSHAALPFELADDDLGGE